MLNLASEKLLTLEQAAATVPPSRGGKRCHISTILRWILAGVRSPGGERVHLEASRLGGRWVTSVEALQRFSEALTPQQQPGRRVRTPRQRRRASERAAAELEKLGI
jgi:hypothetical protein